MATDPIPTPVSPAPPDTSKPALDLPPVVAGTVPVTRTPLPDKTVTVGAKLVAVKATHLDGAVDQAGNLLPPSVEIVATLNGKTHTHTWTIGARDGGVVATLADVQAGLDNARLQAAQHLAIHDAVQAMIPQLT